MTGLPESSDYKNALHQRQVRISNIVTSNDGTQSILNLESPPTQHGSKFNPESQTELKERVDAYSKALGPDSYRAMGDTDTLENVQGTYYINEIGNEATSSFYNPSIQTRRHSTPRKTTADKS